MSQNEAIKEAKTLCTHTIREAEAHQAKLISEAEAQHATCIKEAKVKLCLHHSRGRELLLCSYQEGGVPWCQTGLLHSTVTCWGHAASWDGSHRRLGERSPLLPHHLWGSPMGQPPQSPWVLVTPFHLLLGNAPLSTLLNIPPQYLPLDRNLPYWFLILLPLWHLGLQPYPNGNTHPPAGMYPHPNWKPPQEWALRNHPTWRERMKCLFTEH